VSFVDYFMKYLPFPATRLPTHSCVYWYHIWQFDHFSASPLKSNDSQWYPMHMKHNGASKTLIRLIDGVSPIFHLIQCKNTVPRQQSDRYSAPEPPTTTAPPQKESPNNVDCNALLRPFWMAADYRWWGGWMVHNDLCSFSCVLRAGQRSFLRAATFCETGPTPWLFWSSTGPERRLTTGQLHHSWWAGVGC
jgi:hypothetical protein